MESNTPFFKKLTIKILSVTIAILGLTGSILYSQNNAQSKKEKKKKPPTIYHSSKSMAPTFPLDEKQSEAKNKQKEHEQKESEKPKIDSEESNTDKNIKKSPIMPSSKAPDPSIYKK